MTARWAALRRAALSARHARSGFALPAAIIALVLLSALVAGALFISTEELRAGRTDVEDQRAFAAAEFALDRAVAEWDTRRNISVPVGVRVVIDETTPVAGDRVEVVATRVQRRAFWMTAHATAGRGGLSIPARHTIAASLRLVGPTFPLRAALTAAGAVAVDGGTVDGLDTATVGASTGLCEENVSAVAAGVAAPDPSLVCGAACAGGAPAGVFGTPPVDSVPGLTSDSAFSSFGDETITTLAQRASVVLPGGTLAPRPVAMGGECDRASPLNWGDPTGATACGDYYPIIHVRGNVVLEAGSTGQGILIVDGSLRVSPGARFVGVVVATDDISVVGPAAGIVGAAFAADADRANGSRVADGGTIRLASCAVRRAAIGASRLTRTPVRWWVELR